MKNITQNSLLGGISPEQFLAEYWQKKPLLIRAALPNYTSPISAEELAGLACEEEIESRLVLEKGGEKPWELRFGPFAEEAFTSLPDSHWTLLLQEANKHIPELATLLEEFNFLPSWWFDDIMISYAPDQGTVGPHFDRYDVFLLQVEGEKRWKINTQPVDDNNYIDDIQLRIMNTFEAEYDWLLQPGDMLYLPPGVAHHGIAMGESLTFSIGYRALAQSELLASFSDFALEQLNGKRHYNAPSMTLQPHTGEISAETISGLTKLLQEVPLDPQSVGSWFGKFITEPRNALPLITPEPALTAEQCLEQLLQQELLIRNEQCRFNFVSQSDNSIQLFIDGEQYHLESQLAGFAILLCDQANYNPSQLSQYLKSQVCLDLLLQWVNLGILYFPDDE